MLLKIFAFLTSINCGQLHSLEDLNSFFDEVTDFPGLNDAKQSRRAENYDFEDELEGLIKAIQRENDEKLKSIKKATFKLKVAVEKSLNSTTDIIPQWPTCCGMNKGGQDGIFKADISIPDYDDDPEYVKDLRQRCRARVDPAGFQVNNRLAR